MDTIDVVMFVSVPTILSLIQFLKRIFDRAPGKVWFASSFLMGISALIITGLATVPPVDLLSWLGLVGKGLLSGLAASKAYDEWKARIA